MIYSKAKIVIILKTQNLTSFFLTKKSCEINSRSLIDVVGV